MCCLAFKVTRRSFEGTGAGKFRYTCRLPPFPRPRVASFTLFFLTKLDEILQVTFDDYSAVRLYRISSIKRSERLFKTRPRRPGVYLLSAQFFSHLFFIISTGGLLNYELNFNKNVKINVKQRHQLCLISVNLVSRLAKNITDSNRD